MLVVEISYLGHSSFKIRGKLATIVTDPFDPEMVGLKFPLLEADIVTVSHLHTDHSMVSQVNGAPVVVSGPGEYEIKGVRINGIASYHDNKQGEERGRNIIYSIFADGLTIVHAGDLGHKLSDEQADSFPAVDILMIPVGGVYTIGPAEAAEVVTQLEPKIVIPMHFFQPQMAKQFESLAPVSGFLREMGKESIAPQPKLVISKDKLPSELTVIVLQ